MAGPTWLLGGEAAWGGGSSLGVLPASAWLGCSMVMCVNGEAFTTDLSGVWLSALGELVVCLSSPVNVCWWCLREKIRSL